MKQNRFCFFCGTGFESDRWYEPFDCSICGAIFMPPAAMKEPQLTLEEAQAAFDKIPLTDHQATGRANTGKWARKRK